jgi:uncharacterized membrane protein
MAVGEELRERVARLADCVRQRYRDRVEAERTRLISERALERDRIVQKSRSA